MIRALDIQRREQEFLMRSPVKKMPRPAGGTQAEAGKTQMQMKGAAAGAAAAEQSTQEGNGQGAVAAGGAAAPAAPPTPQ